MYIRNYKVFYGQHFIELTSSGLENLSLLIGKNGAGKSSVLEAIDVFLNNKKWIYNNDNRAKKNEAYMALLFLIDKSVFTSVPTFKDKVKNAFEQVSDFFWSLDDAEPLKRFIDKFKDKKESHYLCLLSISPGSDEKTFTPTFHKKIETLLGASLTAEINNIFKLIVQLYTYVHLPVEMPIKDILRLEQKTLQELMPVSTMRKIDDFLTKGRVNKSGSYNDKIILTYINDQLRAFVDELHDKLGEDYKFKGMKSLLTADIREKIVETYFSKVQLTKNGNPIEDLSSGERRRILIDIIDSLTKEHSDSNKKIILGIDEPEASLHISACFDQFEQLQMISKQSSLQMLIATHWYGSLPTLTTGFMQYFEQGIVKQSFTFENYISRSQKLPNDVEIKSLYDMTSSLISMLRDKKLNILITEGESDKIYIEKFLNINGKDNVRVIAAGCIDNVIKLYSYIKISLLDSTMEGKVYCLVDTDEQDNNVYISIDGKKGKQVVLKRLQNLPVSGSIVTKTFDYIKEGSYWNKTVIEDVLDPENYFFALKSVINSSNDVTLMQIINKEFEYNKDASVSTLKDDQGPLNSVDGISKVKEKKSQLIIFADKYKVKIAQEYIKYNAIKSPSWFTEINDFFS